jgi:phenylacetate-coenzyme A ligase PaaK-like adenylate-forming protein
MLDISLQTRKKLQEKTKQLLRMKTKRHANKELNVSPHVRMSKVNTLVFVYQKRDRVIDLVYLYVCKRALVCYG